MRGLCLLTSKPLVYAANVAEDDLADPSANTHVQQLRAKAEAEGSGVVVVSAQVRRQRRWGGRAEVHGCCAACVGQWALRQASRRARCAVQSHVCRPPQPADEAQLSWLDKRTLLLRLNADATHSNLPHHPSLPRSRRS